MASLARWLLAPARQPRVTTLCQRTLCTRTKNAGTALLNELDKQLDKIQVDTHGFPQGFRLTIEKILDAGPTDDKILIDVESELQAVAPADLTRIANKAVVIAGPGRWLAARLYANASKRGEHNAQYAYAQLLRIGGEGISKDPAQAAVLLTQVASKGHPWGQYVLGIMYANGEAGDTDHEKALSLFETSARNGVAAAHNTLGNMYLAGNGVKPDPSKAVDCFRRGVDAGDVHAYMSLSKCYSEGSGVPQSFEESYKLHLAAAEKGLPAAIFNVGYHYFMGKGVKQSFEQAAAWYERAAAQGFTWAQVNLGNMYVEGRGVERNLQRALDLYREAANRDPHAKVLMLEVVDKMKAEESVSNTPKS